MCKSSKLYVRITIEDYRALVEVCERYQVASISELVRASLDNLTGADAGGLPPADQIRRLNARLAALMAEYERISPAAIQAPFVAHRPAAGLSPPL